MYVRGGGRESGVCVCGGGGNQVCVCVEGIRCVGGEIIRFVCGGRESGVWGGGEGEGIRCVYVCVGESGVCVCGGGGYQVCVRGGGGGKGIRETIYT